MEVRFFLKDKSKKKSPVNAIISFKGRQLKYAVGETVLSCYWNSKTYRCREVREYPDASGINERLAEWVKLIGAAVDNFNRQLIIPSQENFSMEVKRLLSERQPGEQKNDQLFVTDYMQKFIANSDKCYNTSKKYVTTRNLLLEYETKRKKRLTFDDMDMTFYRSFHSWLDKREHVGKNKVIVKGCSVNYFGSIINPIKLILGDAEENGIEVNQGWKSKKFKVVSEESDSIYLTVDELIKIHRMEITEDLILNVLGTKILGVKHNMRVKIKSLYDLKDKFLIGAFTAMRFSDYNTITGIKSTDEFISKRTEKTGARVVIPMHWVIREILERRGNVLPGTISNTKLNDALKDIGKLAGLKDKVDRTITQGGSGRTVAYEKWELITTHTARRSGCTNMYMAGIDMYAIMGFSGHKTASAFLKYIKVSQEQNAAKLKDHAFFNQSE